MTFARQSWSYLSPEPIHLIWLLGILLVIPQLLALGRVAGARRSPIEIQVVVGWGVAVLLLTAWGCLTPWPLWQPAIAIAVLSVIILGRRTTRPGWTEWRTLGRLALLILPIILLSLTIRPVMSDTLLNLLPNAEYLWDFQTFPRNDEARTDSIYPALPYNTQLIGYLAGWWAPSYPVSSMMIFNIIMQGLFGLFLARQFLGSNDRFEAPGWLGIGLGMLFTTALNPGFRPEINLADYGEPTTMITLAMAGWLGSRLLGDIAAGKAQSRDALLLGLVLAVLVNVRQSNIGLVLALLSGFLLVILCDSRLPRRRALVLFGLAMLPALGLYFGWRLYVETHFEMSELKLRALDKWQFTMIPDIFVGMWLQASRRPFLFLLYLGLLIGAGRTLIRRRTLDGASRLAVITAATMISFNGFLFALYISHFNMKPGGEAHSFFRYNAHMVLLFLTTAATYLHEIGFSRRLSAATMRFRPSLAAAMAVVMVVGPMVLMRQVRYDLQMPRPIVWNLAKAAAARISNDEKLAIVAPGDEGSTFLLLRATIAMTEPRRSGVDFLLVNEITPETPSDLAAKGYDNILVTCAEGDWPDVPKAHAAFLRRSGDGWAVEDLGELQPAWTSSRYWAKSFQRGPFCLD